MLKHGWSWQHRSLAILCLLTCATVVALLNSAPKVAAKEQTPTTRRALLFDFHSNFWVNLHQVLFHEALLRAGKPDRRLQSNTALAAPEVSEQEKAEWNAAITFYSANFGSRQELVEGAENVGSGGDKDLIAGNVSLDLLPGGRLDVADVGVSVIGDGPG